MQSVVNLQTQGLFSEPNQLNVPEGALTEASNVIIQRDNIIEPRRGFELFGTTFGTITDRLKQLFVYKFRLLRHWGSTLEFDTGTMTNAGQELFSAFNTSVVEPQNGLRIKSVESNGNFYFTSSQGIRKISALTADGLTTDPGFVTLSGGVKALDLTAVPILQQGNITGFLPADSAVAYRTVWGTIDANKNLILGVPSQRAEVFNTLNGLVLLDFNNVLESLQNVAFAGGSILSNTTLVSLLGLSSSATPQQLQANLIALATELDTNILLANDTGAGVPLTISCISIINNTTTANSNVATITFSAGNPENYWIPGSHIFLNTFPNGETGSVNGLETVNTVTPTTITFLTAATGNSQTFVGSATAVTVGTPGIITIANHGFQNNDPIKFTNSGGALPTVLVAGTVYYVGGVTTNTFQVFAAPGPATPVNISAVGSGTNTVTYFMPITNTSINSGEFRFLTQPLVPNNPATANDLLALQAYLQQIMTVLQTFPSTGTPPIISAASQSTFVSILSTTTSVNVKLDITIPQGLSNQYFLQIYRSPIVTATGVTPLSDLTPSDELQQVYEAFPTAAELAQGYMIVIDTVTDQFLGADLYTNEASGVGIANANEDPPFALDINKFKNTVFLANTRTKYRMSLNLLGVIKMVQDFLAGSTPELVISDGITTNRYFFVLGVQQVTQATTVADVAGSLAGKYFLINSAQNNILYYIWYNVSGTGTDPKIESFNVAPANATIGATYTNNGQTFTVSSTIAGGTTLITSSTGTPLVSGILTKTGGTGDAFITFTSATPATGVEVFLITGNSAAIVASKTNDALNTLIGVDFISSIQNYTFTVTAANATVGSIYSNNSQTFTVISSISGGTTLKTTGTGAPLVSGILNLVSGSGDATITYSAFTTTANIITIINTAEGSTSNALAGTSGFTVTTLTSGGGDNVSTHQVLLSNKTSPAQAIDETARSLVRVINRNPLETIYAFYLSQASTVPGEMTLESRLLTTPKYYLLANNADTGSSFSPNLSPNSTIHIVSITTGSPSTNIITTSGPHNLVTGDKVMFSDTNSTPSLDGLWTILNLSSTTFRINTTVTGAATSGQLLAAVDAQGGDDEAKPNRIYYSSFQEPESFPLGNTIDVGDRDKAILRIFPVRDSLFVFKEDGLFRISGEVAPFTLQLFDTSCVLIAPDSVAISKNVIYGWTTQGILSITEAGVSNPPASRPIDVNILPLTKENYPNFVSATWGVGYESDNSYIVFTVQSTNDTEATIAYRYSTMTTSWTTYAKTDTCGIVDIADDKLYLGAGDINSIEQERKTFSRHDYADRELASTLVLNKYFGNSMNLPNVSQFKVGDVLVQTQNLTIYEFNILLDKLSNDPGLQENLISNITIGSTPTITTTGNHFLTTGDFVNITNTQTTPNVDGLYQVTVTSANTFTINVPSPILTAGTVGLVKYNYFENLKIVAGSDLKTALIALANRLDIEPSLIFNYLSGISFKSGAITGISVADPSIITAPGHGMVSNRYVQITGTNSDPIADGNYSITFIDVNTFSIPLNVLTAGTTGFFITLDGTFQDVLTNYNYIIHQLNTDSGTVFKNYQLITSTTPLETIINKVNKFTNTITTDLALDYVVGPLSIFQSIPTGFTYSPVTFKDALSIKHISEATLMFENKQFTRASLEFKSDLIPNFIPTPVIGNGNGNFGMGTGPFGGNFFGGGANAAPFRTYIPRDTQRCRYIVPRFSHSIALEKYSINGLTLTGTLSESSRAYR